MATDTSDSMAQNPDWLDNFLEICEGVYADTANCPENEDPILDDPTCIYCGASFREQIFVAEGGKKAGTTNHICPACRGKQVTNVHRCQELVRKTVQNVKILFSISMDIKWDVRRKRIPIEWNRKKEEHTVEAMPWEHFVEISRAKEDLFQLKLKANVPAEMVVASVVYFLCIQCLTANQKTLKPSLQGLGEWFVVNYLRIFDMERFASCYEQLWSAKKGTGNKCTKKNGTEEVQNRHASSQYDFWVQILGKPTGKNTVTINTPKLLVSMRQDTETRGCPDGSDKKDK